MIPRTNNFDFFLQSIISIVLVLLCLTSCQTSPKPKYSDHAGINHRIKKHILKYDNLSEQHKTKVRQGEIVEGMSRDAVFLAWGKADRVQQASTNGRKSEHWAYFASDPVSTASVGYGGGGPWGGGYHHGGTGWGVGSDVHVVDYVARSVDFASDRVVAWQRSR